MLEGLGGALESFFLVQLGPYNSMRTEHCALSTLYACLRIPRGYVDRDIAFFVLRSRGRPRPVHRHLRDLDRLTLSHHDLGGSIFYEFGSVVRNYRLLDDLTLEFRRDVNLFYLIYRHIHRLYVHVDYLIALGAVGLFYCLLDGFYGDLFIYDIRYLEESGLHYHVYAAAQAYFLGYLYRVDDIKLYLFVYYLFLDLRRDVFPHFVLAVHRSEKEGSAVNQVLEHIVLLKEREVMACQEVGPGYKIRAPYLFFSEPQMRYRNGSRFLGVINKIPLGVVVGFLSYYLDRVLVGSYGTV